MSWARLDDSFHDHPKVDGLSLSAVGLYTLCLTWAHRHRKTALLPGHITESRVKKLAGKQAHALVTELVTAGLWEIEDGLGGWVIHDFADYLPKERDPDERREAGRRGAAKRWHGDGKPDGKLLAADMASDSSRASAPASPSRTRPEVVNSVGGERPETLRAVPATQPPQKQDAVCSRHPDGNPNDDPCGGCKRINERENRKAAAEDDRIQRANERARLACKRCDGAWVTDDAGNPTRRKCDHRRTA